MRVDFRIVYSSRRTLSLVVERDASVVVRAPEGTSEERIREAIEARKIWLFQKVNHEQKYPPRRQSKEFVTGETIPYLGRNYRLEITREPVAGLRFHSRFVISRRSRNQAASVFRKWYEDRATERIPARARSFASAMGVVFKEVLISNMKVRWGSCTPGGNLNFNWRLMKAPGFVIDYVIVHELAHLREANHTARFWNIVSVQVSRWLEAKAWLREHGDLLEVDFGPVGKKPIIRGHKGAI